MSHTEAKTIKDFQDKIKFIYSGVNSKRNHEYIYSYLFRNASYLSRSVLRSGDTKSYFIKTFSWLFSFGNSIDVDVEMAFRKKFPDVCPYCLDKPCSCIQNHKKPRSYLPAHKIRAELERKHEVDINFYKSFDIDQAVLRINSIYPANQSIWSVYGSFYHFTRIFEELGEIHEAFTTYQKDHTRKINLEEEIADFIAWLLSAWKIQMQDESLLDALNEYYMHGCPVCKNSSCICIDYSDRHESIAKSQDLIRLKLDIQKLQDSFNGKKEELTELLSSIDDAIETKSTTDAKRVVTETKSTLENISKTVNTVKDISDSTQSIAKVIAPIFKYISELSWNS